MKIRMPQRTPIPDDFLLTVVIPCFNERATIAAILQRVGEAWPTRKQVIVVDDASSDGTAELLRGELAPMADLVIHHTVNSGKGAALRAGFAAALGDLVVVQDADLEYDPADWQRLMRPFFDADADIVYGSRFLGGPDFRRANSYWHRAANSILTAVSNVVTDLHLTDAHTCYKAFRRDALVGIEIREDRFAVCPELTVKFARRGYRFFEVPISYERRGIAQGKKIGLKDAFRAVYALAKYGLLRR